MGSDLKLTAEQIEELESIVATDYYGHAEIGRLQKLLPALIAAAKRATAAEARVGELEDVRKHAEQLVYIISQWRNGGLRIGACKQAEDKLIEAIARTALKPQGEAALDELTAETERLGLYMPPKSECVCGHCFPAPAGSLCNPNYHKDRP